MARPRPPLDGPADLRWTRAEEPSAQGELFGDEAGRPARASTAASSSSTSAPAGSSTRSRAPPPTCPSASRSTRTGAAAMPAPTAHRPDTPVLLAEGRVVRIADLRVGDLVVGTERIGKYRRYVATPVLDHWSTVRPAWRVTLEDGTELIASGDHRFLSPTGAGSTSPAQSTATTGGRTSRWATRSSVIGRVPRAAEDRRRLPPRLPLRHDPRRRVRCSRAGRSSRPLPVGPRGR